MSKKRKIAVAMSGGVDSSVAALILKRRGYDVVGVNLNLWSCFKGSKAKTCCSPEDRLDAQRVCEIIGIPFTSVDMRDRFKKQIIEPFAKEYSEGRTPNPCIRCNTLIKFDAMFKWLHSELGIDKIATGHYAQIVRDERGAHLLRGTDKTKDQSYFLFDLPGETLENILFPLGEYTKEASRKMAAEEGLAVAEKTDSQEVCFIPDNDVASFIEDFHPGCSRPRGNFINRGGTILGQHRGIHAYTIGQRRGLGVATGSRIYVTEIRPESGEVVLGDDNDLLETKLLVDDLNMIEKREGEFAASVKIRYRSDPVPARVTIGEGDSALVKFESAVRAITPGQAAVFYDGDLVIGGGWIK
jgi:tRNA-specific 2-thiouridylase